MLAHLSAQPTAYAISVPVLLVLDSFLGGASGVTRSAVFWSFYGCLAGVEQLVARTLPQRIERRAKGVTTKLLVLLFPHAARKSTSGSVVEPSSWSLLAVTKLNVLLAGSAAGMLSSAQPAQPAPLLRRIFVCSLAARLILPFVFSARIVVDQELRAAKIRCTGAGGNSGFGWLILAVQGLMLALLYLIMCRECGLSGGFLLSGFGLGGVLVALSLQEAGKECVAAFTLLFSRTFRVGDIIHCPAAGCSGMVLAVNFRHTMLRDLATRDVVHVPNVMLMNKTLRNQDADEVVDRKLDMHWLLSLDCTAAQLRTAARCAREALAALTWEGGEPAAGRSKRDPVTSINRATITAITPHGANLAVFAFVHCSGVAFQAECISRVNIHVHGALADAGIKLATPVHH
jgi:small-conductance mechanosensitive channel